MKILVVEDNEANLELFGDLFRIRGHDVIEAMSGKEAVNAAKDIPIVALTAHAMDGDMGKSLECGCNAYITKPIDTRNFTSEIENIFSSVKE